MVVPVHMLIWKRVSPGRTVYVNQPRGGPQRVFVAAGLAGVLGRGVDEAGCVAVASGSGGTNKRVFGGRVLPGKQLYCLSASGVVS